MDPDRAVSILAKLIGRKPERVEPPSQPEAHELRNTTRELTYKVVTVTYPTGYERKGIVADISATGVRVRFSQRGELPHRVNLKITGVAGSRTAEVAWQEAYEAGLRFVG